MIFCHTCKTSKPDNHFGRSKVKNGKARCLKCGRDATKKSYYKHQAKNVAKSKEYRENNPDAGREAKFKYKYGISLSKYEQMYKFQEGRCAICRDTSDNYLDVDHDHVTKEVRGLLCRSCNVGLGHFSDEPVILEAAIKYLTRFKDT